MTKYAILFVLLTIFSIPIALAYAETFSGDTKGIKVSIDLSENLATGKITLNDGQVISFEAKPIQKDPNKIFVIDRQNDVKILLKQTNEKYFALVKSDSTLSDKIRLLLSNENVQKTPTRNLLEEMQKQSEEPEENPDALTHKERQNLSKQQKIQEIIKQQRETRLINEKQGEIGQSILDSFNSAQSSTTGPALLLKDPNQDKKDFVPPPVKTFDIAAFLSVPHNGEWKKEMIYDVLVTDTSGHRYDSEYKSFTGNELKDVAISGEIKNPSGVAIDEFEGTTGFDGKYKNTFFIPDQTSTIGEYVVSVKATKYFSDNSSASVRTSDTFFVFPARDSGGSNASP